LNSFRSLVAKKNEKTASKKPKIDFKDMENLFCQQSTVTPQNSVPGNTKKDETVTDGCKKKDEVSH